ncbi:hypothetical protein MSAN_02206500 [Mycena sanguinolenta]|uniref:Uncharacterized protein n=1 Tax=Mycena sanguinolenta TaxID=230812 RepID=A0A8H6XE33_9AGAR|nr:hypothetical protein MSAN_02206500 [Mycena sanguinolenta]
MRRLFRSMSTRSASDNGSIASMPPPYQAVEASDPPNLQTSPSAFDPRPIARRSSSSTGEPPRNVSRLVSRRSSRSTVTPSARTSVFLASTPEETSETADSDAGLMGYCYYRIYTPDGAVPSKTTFNPRNPYLGRIAVRSVPPPQRVGSLKRRLVTVEQLPAQSQQVLLNGDGFTTAAGMGEEEPILLNAQVPGSAPYGTTPETAFALLLSGADVEKAANARMISARIPSTQAHPVYLYYRLFTPIGEDTSKVQFNPKDPALGRIERKLLAPPHNADSIKHQIARLEGKRIYAYAELYTNISAPRPIESTAYLSLMQDNGPGMKEDNPMVLVQPERRPKLYNRPIEVILAYTAVGQDGERQLAVGQKGCQRRCSSEKRVLLRESQGMELYTACQDVFGSDRTNKTGVLVSIGIPRLFLFRLPLAYRL